MDSAININEIKYRIEDYLLFCLSNEESLHFLKEKELPLFDVIESFVLRKAKRIRPILLLLAFQGYADKENNSVIHAAIAVELMHTFALIHDDIIDQSQMRDNNPSLYHAIDSLSCKMDSEGQRMAMLIGDLIYNIALNEFQKVDVGESTKITGMKLLLDTALKTGHGQLNEMIQSQRNIAGITQRQIFEIYDLKTAGYTFCLPFKLGALFGGSEKQELEYLDELGIMFGRAYQMIDDINDFSPENLERNNILSALLWKHSEQAERKRLRRLYSSANNSTEEIEWLKDLFSKHNIVGLATSAVYRLIEEAAEGISKLSLQETVKELLTDYIRSIMKIKK